MRKLTSFIAASLLLGVYYSYSQSSTNTKEIELYSEGKKLTAHFYQSSSNDLSPTLVMLHGVPQGKGDVLGLGSSLSPKGINVLIFNYRGTWESEGEFSLDNSLEDINNALDYLYDEQNSKNLKIDLDNIIVGGFSFGGGMALNSAIWNPRIKRIISISGADQSVFGRLYKSDPNWQEWWKSMLDQSFQPNGPLVGDPTNLLNVMESNMDKFDLVKNADSLVNKDILIITGWDDQVSTLEAHILPLYRKLKILKAENVSINAFDSGHMLEMNNTIENLISDWIFKLSSN